MTRRFAIALAWSLGAIRLTSAIHQAEVRRLDRVMEWQNEQWGAFDARTWEAWTDAAHRAAVMYERERRRDPWDFSP